MCMKTPFNRKDFRFLCALGAIQGVTSYLFLVSWEKKKETSGLNHVSCMKCVVISDFDQKKKSQKKPLFFFCFLEVELELEDFAENCMYHRLRW